MKISAGLLLLLLLSTTAQVRGDYQPDTSYGSTLQFIETFQQSAHFLHHTGGSNNQGWIKSGEERYSSQEWAHGTVQDGKQPGIDGDKSIVVAVANKHYGISRMMPVVIDNTNKDLVVQYEVRLHSGITCSGAYLKLITQDKDFSPKTLNEKSGYTIMFGPDRCGPTNKVHLIFRVMNPVSGEWEEKHLAKNVPAEIDALTHLYTLELRKDNSFRVLVDLVEKVSGSLLDEGMFSPPMQPPKEIDDPKDKKPSDWVDAENMPDPQASKPDDWDEDAPAKIPDPDAFKPIGWEDNEPETIPDPNAEKPQDWIDEEDGEWEPPQIKNPKCAVGCGEWKAPIINNPRYKGKWTPPMIPNPNYIGKWRPRKIPNPNYYEDEHPSDLAPIGAVAIEILANDRGIAFDNIVIGYDIAAARKFAEETFVVKQGEEMKIEKVLSKEKRIKERELIRKDGGIGSNLIYYGVVVYDFALENAIAVGVAVCIGLISLLYWCFYLPGPDPVADPIAVSASAGQAATAATPGNHGGDDDEDDSDDEDEDTGAGATPKKDS